MPIIELDTIPKQLFHRARDWGDLLVTRQLAEPLFYETPNRGIASNIFGTIRRTAATTWELAIHDGLTNTELQQVSARQIAVQMMQVGSSRNPSALTLALVEAIRVIDHTTLQLHTRIPIGDISRCLTSPALGIPHSIENAAAFTLHDGSTDQALILQKGGRACCSLRLATVSQLKSFVQMHALAATSLFTGTLVDPGCGYDVTQADLDIVVGIQFSTSLRPDDVDSLVAAVDRTRLLPDNPGLFRPILGLADLWEESEQENSTSRPITRWQGSQPPLVLQYHDYFPNGLLAKNLADQLSEALAIRVHPVPVPYLHQMSTTQRVPPRTLRLSLIAPAWAHPAAFLTPLAVERRLLERADDEFAIQYRQALATESLPDAARHAVKAERDIHSDHLPFVPLGRLRTHMVHHPRPIWIPPSGWLDFSQLLSQA